MKTYRNDYNTSMALAWMNSVYSHDNIANNSSYQEPEYHSSSSYHPVDSAAIIHQAVSVPIIQAVPVVIQVVQVAVAVSAADGDNVNMPAIPAAISSASMKTVRDSVPETMKS